MDLVLVWTVTSWGTVFALIRSRPGDNVLAQSAFYKGGNRVSD